MVFLFRLNNIPLYGYTLHFLYSFICGWTFRLFLCFSIVNSAVYVLAWVPVFKSSGYSPRGRIAESNGNPMFNFLSNSQTVLYSNYTIYSPTRRIWQFQFFPILANTSYFPLCFLIAILAGMMCLSVVLVHIFLVTNDAEHHFMCWWPLVYCFWRNVYSGSLPIFGIGLFVFFVIML